MISGFQVTLSDVSKKFDSADGSTTLANITGTVEPGEILAICGRSGVGKSTLLRLIAGLETLTAGAISVDGKPVSSPGPHMAYVVQDYTNSLFPWLRVRNNILLALANSPRTRAEKMLAVGEQLEAVGLGQYANHYPWQLSGGMQQRVAIARAFVGSPRLLLMDEPFASVDAQTRLDLEDLTLKLVRQSQATAIFVTHDIEEAVYLADRIWVLGGKPATITHQFPVQLGAERNQKATRANPDFTALRNNLFDALRTLAPDGSNE